MPGTVTGDPETSIANFAADQEWGKRMVPRIFPTPADWLATLLRRWVRKGYALNVTLADDGIELAIGLEDGERVVALVQTADGRAIILTSERVVEQGRTVLRYGEVVRCDWITDEPRPRDLRRLKQTHFDRLILELENGGKVVLVGLGQAVFPMQRFFNSMISAVGPNAGACHVAYCLRHREAALSR
jgi:hypothetical protein